MSRRKSPSPKPERPQPSRGVHSRAPAKRKSTRGAPARSPARSKSAQPARSSRSTRRAAAPRAAPSPRRSKSSFFGNLSTDRKLDLVGIGLSLFGLLSFLVLLSSANGRTSAAALLFLRQAFGWGVYLLPGVLLAVGLWLVLRKLDRLPELAPERIVGLVLLFVNLLAIFNLLGGRAAGGSLGNGIGAGLVAGLGLAGAWVVLAAWLLVGLTLFLDVSVPDIFRWVPPLVQRLGLVWDRLLSRLSASGRRLPAGSRPGFEGDFQPLPRPGDELLSSSSPTPGMVAHQPQPAGQPPVWVLPAPAKILDAGLPPSSNGDQERDRVRVIEETLRSFGAPGHIVDIQRGPTVTQFGLEPDFVESRTGRMRVRVSKVVSLADDLKLALAAPSIRIQAPVPGRAYIGIEVPNGETSLVSLLDILQSEAMTRLRSPLRFAIGKDVGGRPVAADLTSMPHLLIAGTTGSGKSVCVNTLLTCLLVNNTPDDLRLILVDPKRVELTGYNGIPHLLAPVVTDAEKVIGALQWMMREMDTRYKKFADLGARNIVDYNARLQAKGEQKLPYLVVVIDELADLMMLAPDETERTITRLAQLARATGLHLIIATQRPSVDVLTGLIKANFPARIAFAVASGVDSRVILDQPGAERLLGRGDMLFQAPDAPAPLRLQGAYVSDAEIQRLVYYWRGFVRDEDARDLVPGQEDTGLPAGAQLKQVPLWEEASEADEDPMVAEAIELVRREGRASISMLQRRLRIGYSRAARIVDRLEEKGIISPSQPNSQVRQVLDYGPLAPPADAIE